MPRKETIITIRNPKTGSLHKITKIVAYRTGGFSVLTPYHSTRSGYLMTIPVDARRIGEYRVDIRKATAFSAKDRVKLSYHPDGFVQFSGEIGGKIISGKEPKTGLPKGIGLMSSPLSSPIFSGPSFGLVVWGIDEFEQVQEESNKIVVFEESDWYYRVRSPNDATAWFIESFVFPEHYWGAVRKDRRGFNLTLSFLQFEASMGVIELRVIELPKQPIFLGILVSRIRTNFSASSGWTICGPGERAKTEDRYLFAFYPEVGFPKPKRSLDRY